MTSARSARSVRRAALSGLLGVAGLAALATAGPAFANNAGQSNPATQPTIHATGLLPASPSTTHPVQVSATAITRDPCAAITHVVPNCVPPPPTMCPDGATPVAGPDPCPPPPPPTYLCPNGTQPLPGNIPCPPKTTTPPPTIYIPQTPPPTIYIQTPPQNPDFVIVRPSFTG